MSERAETGPIRIGDDWAGVFIRGDNALMGLLPCVQWAAEVADGELARLHEGFFHAPNLHGLCILLASAAEGAKEPQVAHLGPAPKEEVKPTPDPRASPLSLSCGQEHVAARARTAGWGTDTGVGWFAGPGRPTAILDLESPETDAQGCDRVPVYYSVQYWLQLSINECQPLEEDEMGSFAEDMALLRVWLAEACEIMEAL